MTDAAARRSRAWVFLVLGALVAWGALGVATGTGNPLAWVVFLAAVGSVVYGITLFQRAPTPARRAR